ncbi:MAG: hypothetical protein JWM27_2814 [Gemmatimonadetes bacterium]|nr:hypothetical protein [Gemmatimonadota bacterium]
MARKYVFADESGNFDFSRRNGASRYFILATISCDSCTPGDALLTLRRELAWEGHGLNSEFHATDDPQSVRDRVFALIAREDFRVNVTVLEKSKALPRLRTSDETFYKTAWYLHLRHVAPRVAGRHDELLVVSASLGTRARRQAMYAAVHDVVSQVTPTADFRAAACRPQRSVPAGGRLLLLGAVAKVGARRPPLVRPDRAQARQRAGRVQCRHGAPLLRTHHAQNGRAPLTSARRARPS